MQNCNIYCKHSLCDSEGSYLAVVNRLGNSVKCATLVEMATR